MHQSSMRFNFIHVNVNQSIPLRIFRESISFAVCVCWDGRDEIAVICCAWGVIFISPSIYAYIAVYFFFLRRMREREKEFLFKT